MYLNVYGMHFNETQWQKPTEFIPERFDLDSPYSLTPTGDKRHPMAWIPFNGGKRVCFGKTFAEVNLKILQTYLTQHFDFDFVNKKFYEKVPIAHIGQSKILKKEVSLSLRKQ